VSFVPRGTTIRGIIVPHFAGLRKGGNTTFCVIPTLPPAVPAYDDLADLVNELRQRRGLTVAQLAEATGEKKRRLDSYFQKERTMPGLLAAVLLRELGMADTAITSAVGAITGGDSYSLDGAAAAGGSVVDTREPGDPGPRHLRNLPLEVRVYLEELRLRLTKGGATEDEVDRAIALLRRPSIFSWYSVGTPKDLSPEKVLQTMKAITEGVILPYLRDQGRKV
jgi:transcriptional regulator with XRE-family HTH domain